MMTALSFGVPQILIPDPTLHRANEMARRLVEAGAAITLSPEEATTDVIAKNCQEIISNPGTPRPRTGSHGRSPPCRCRLRWVRRVEWLVHEASGGRRD